LSFDSVNSLNVSARLLFYSKKKTKKRKGV
jgi:hypothetical protein